MSKIYDLVIIGGGPAGLSAGIYAGRAKMNTLIIEKGELGGQVNKTFDISNYPGSRNTNGPKLMSEMRAQAEDFNSSFEATKYLLEKQLKEIVFVSADSTPTFPYIKCISFSIFTYIPTFC